MEQKKTKTTPLPRTNVDDMLWTLLRDRIQQNAGKLKRKRRSYVECNNVPGAGE